MGKEIQYNRLNMVAEVLAFWRISKAECFSQNAHRMWEEILQLCNDTRWRKWVSIDNRRMAVLIGANSDTAVIRARNELIQAGVILFEKGCKGHPNRYAILPMTQGDTPDTTPPLAPPTSKPKPAPQKFFPPKKHPKGYSPCDPTAGGQTKTRAEFLQWCDHQTPT